MQNRRIFFELDSKTHLHIHPVLGSGVFDEKLQDPWALLLKPSFSLKRNCRTLVQSNSVIHFFDEAFQFHHFSIKPSCCFLQRMAFITIFFSFVVKA